MPTTEVSGVSLVRQHGKEVYLFKLSAAELLRRGIVKRLTDPDCDDAIQRELIESHALNIAEAMLDLAVFWPDTFVVAFQQEPTYSSLNGTITLPDDFQFLVDDGQHRWCGLKIIEEMGEDIPDIEFVVYGTFGLSVAERVKLFKLQTKRRPVNRDFNLALSAKAGSYASEGERRAHAVILRLGNDEDSPLKGLIALPGYQRSGAKACWLSPAHLVKTLQGMFAPGGRGPWEKLTDDQVVASVKVYFNELMLMWPEAWSDPRNFALKTNRAIVALLVAFSSHEHSRMHVRSYTQDGRVKEFARLFTGFPWYCSARSNQNTRVIGHALDAHITRAVRGIVKRT